jgi:release factor glutamine methyltransferase
VTAATAEIRLAAERLASAGVTSPRVDAELLAAHVLDVTRGRLPLVDFDTHTLARYRRLVQQRAERVPLQHLTGSAPFRTVQLLVGPGVFVPRPETEVVAGQAVSLARARPQSVVIDLCAGSGAIGLAIAVEAPGSRVTAVESEPAAAAWCRRNAAALADEVAAVGSAFQLVNAAVDADWSARLDGSVDLIVANPPYVPDDAVPREPEVARYDPPTALYGGVDGLTVVRQVVTVAGRLLRPGGTLLIEHGEWQAPAIRSLLAESAWEQLVTGQDLTGRDRWTGGRRR